MSESYQFKRMIHGIHGNSKRTYPFTHGNKVIGVFSMAGILTVDGLIGSVTAPPDGTQFLPFATGTLVTAGTPLAADVVNYAAEVAWPGVGLNCNACHVNNSYKVDRGPLGAVVSKPAVGTPLAADPNPMNWKVISPMAATCTACHNKATSIAHATSFGNASYGSKTQSQSLLTQEICADCHSSGGFKGVDIVHGQQ
jgi:OmcA/MtrC family decaheme c-type cytochrome